MKYLLYTRNLDTWNLAATTKAHDTAAALRKFEHQAKRKLMRSGLRPPADGYFPAALRGQDWIVTAFAPVRRAVRSAFTLIELLVSMALTVIMLAATAVVFTTSTKAAGQARASNEIMQQLRAVTHQLQTDFDGLRPEMPLVFIFDNSTGVRRDRVVFWANGNFQTFGGVASNMARVWYGQADNGLPLTLEDDSVGQRFPLLRRQKLMLNLNPKDYPPPSDNQWVNMDAQNFDYYDYENSTMSFWHNQPDYMFPTYLSQTDNRSLVRRPSMENIPFQALQKLYVLRDVENFEIQVYIGDKWFPEIDQWTTPGQIALYYNSVNLTNDQSVAFTNIDGVSYYHADDISATWPKAIKFTFTIFDHDRRHFPEGRTFNYLVSIPEK